MKKFLPFILIVFIIVNLFAPIGVEINNNKIIISKNLASAGGDIAASTLSDLEQGIRYDAQHDCLYTPAGTVPTTKEVCVRANYVMQGSKIRLSIYTIGLDHSAWLSTIYDVKTDLLDSTGKVVSTSDINTKTGDTAQMQYHKITEDNNIKSNFVTKDEYGNDKKWDYDGFLFISSINAPALNTSYTINITTAKLKDVTHTIASGVPAAPFITTIIPEAVGDPINLSLPVQTNSVATQITTGTSASGNTTLIKKNAGPMPGCAIIGSDGTFMGCVAQAIYYVIFQPTSFLFALSGVLFDHTFAYSVESSSYSVPFVLGGWTVVRDLCNMFFIFVLLYIAIQTVLSLHGAKTKETIINVVIIGVLINFSLFTTQVIIDASNIMARVFYNSDSIKITQDSSGQQVGGGTVNATGSVGTDGTMPLSSALVNKINPQSLIINSDKVNIINDTKGKAGGANNTNGDSKDVMDAGTFILVTLLASAVNIVGFIVFLTVGLIFIARVVGLWLAMIFSPFAFFSYTVPEMQGFDMVGWKKWWPDTLKMAFLAPIFIFFLYLILKFLESGLNMMQTVKQTDGLTFVLSIVIPFVIIMTLLLKAKTIATDLSGKFGEMASKAGSMVGGLALAAATGGTAMLGRATLGAAGSSIAESDKLREASTKSGIKGFGARMLLKTGGAASKASFDARNTTAGAAAGKGLGVNLGKGKTGGYEKMKSEQLAKSEARKKQIELSQSSPQKKKLREEEAALQGLKNKNSVALEKAEIDIGLKKEARDKALATLNIQRGTPGEQDAKEKANTADKEYQDALDAKRSIRSGGEILDKDGKGTGLYNTHNGKIGEDKVEKTETDLKDSEEKLGSSRVESEKADEELKKAEEEKTKAEEAVRSAQEAYDKDDKNETLLGSLYESQAALTQSETSFVEKTMAADTKLEAYSLAKANQAEKFSEAEKIRKIAVGGTGKSMLRLESKFIPEAHHHITAAENKNKEAEAERISGWGNKAYNMVVTGGQYSAETADMAAHSLRMNIKPEAGAHH